MKTILLCILCLVTAARCQEPPKPFSIALPGLDAEKSAKLTVLVNDLLAHARAADARLRDEDTLLKGLEAKEATAEAMVTEIQKKIDKDEALIVKLKAWRTFGRFVLLLLAAVAFRFVWQLTAGIPFPPPWGTAIRIGICCAAGAAASGLCFYVVTHLL